MQAFLRTLGLEEINGYRFLRRLSGGEMAAVAIYERSDQPTTLKSVLPHAEPPTQVVVKFLIAPRRDLELEAFRREAETLMMLRKSDIAHTIVKGLSTVQSSENFPVHYFFMEYVEGQTLRNLLETEPLPWDYRKGLDYLRRIATALLPATAYAEIHRDIHPGNILIVEPTPVPPGSIIDHDPGIRILDFGTSHNWLSVARQHWQEDRFRHSGAVSAWSPEYLNDPGKVDPKHDVWALGTMFYRMVTGEHAFPADCFRTYYDLAQEGQYDMDALSDLPDEVQRLVAGMFRTSPRERLSLSGIRKIAGDILDHNLGGWLRRHPILTEMYFLVEGDMWICPLCKSTGNPASGSRCRACKRYVDEFLSPFLPLVGNSASSTSDSMVSASESMAPEQKK